VHFLLAISLTIGKPFGKQSFAATKSRGFSQGSSIRIILHSHIMADHPYLILKEFFSVQNYYASFQQQIVLSIILGRQKFASR